MIKRTRTELGEVNIRFCPHDNLFTVDGIMNGHCFAYTTTDDRQALNMYKNVAKDITPIQKEKAEKDRVDLGCSPSTNVTTIGA